MYLTSDHTWNFCADLKYVRLHTRLHTSNIDFYAIETAEPETNIIIKGWPLREKIVPGLKNLLTSSTYNTKAY